MDIEDCIPDACDTLSERLAQLTTTAQAVSEVKDSKAKRILLDAMSAVALTLYPVAKPEAKLFNFPRLKEVPPNG